MPAPLQYNRELIAQFEAIKELVTQVRSIRKDKNLLPREGLKLLVRPASDAGYHNRFEPLIAKLANLSDIELIEKEPAGAVSFMVRNVEYFILLGELMDVTEEIGKLESELEYTRGFLESVQRKMNNSNFVQHAPAHVVEKERQKMGDAEGKIAALEIQIEKLKEQA
jgi:valyl-tRNA synthetase